MDQIDLFTTQDHTPSAQDITPTAHAITPVSNEPARKPVVVPAKVHEGTILDFALREGTRLWDKPTHRERSLAQLERFVRFADHETRLLTDYLPKHIHAFSDSLLAEGLKPTSINRYLSTVSKVFAHAVDEEEITHSPKLKFQKEQKVRPRFFSDDEIQQAIDFFVQRGDQWMADMFLLGVKTGMRRGEILALGGVSDAGKVKGRLSLAETAMITPDSKWIFLPAAATKTNEDRHVPLGTIEVVEAARRLVESLPQKFSHRTFYRRWGLLKREMNGLDDRFVFHVTRHTAATTMANDLQVPTAMIQKMLGHATIQTTQKYVHGKDDAMQAIAARM